MASCCLAACGSAACADLKRAANCEEAVRTSLVWSEGPVEFTYLTESHRTGEARFALVGNLVTRENWVGVALVPRATMFISQFDEQQELPSVQAKPDDAFAFRAVELVERVEGRPFLTAFGVGMTMPTAPVERGRDFAGLPKERLVIAAPAVVIIQEDRAVLCFSARR